MTYKIRPATSNDVPQLYDLTLELFAESAQPEQSINRVKGRQCMEDMLAGPHPRHEIFLAERDGVVVGFLKCFLASYWYSDDVRAVHEMVYVTKDHRMSVAAVQLFQEFENWARANDAIFASASIYVPASGAQIAFHSLMLALHYEVAGSLYKKDLTNVR